MRFVKLFVIVVAFMFGFAAMAEQYNSPVIEVNGTSSISIVPDRITVEIGLEEYFKPTSKDSVKVSIRAIELEVRKTLYMAGVADSLITVADVGNYSNRGMSSKFLMGKRLSAVLTDFSQLDKVSDNLPDLGVTSFSITKLDNSDMARYNKEGLKAALDAARAKVELISASENMPEPSVWKVEETTPAYSLPQAFNNVSYQDGAGMENMRRIERRYSVRVTYLTDIVGPKQ